MKIFKIHTDTWHIIRVVFLIASVIILVSLALTFLTGNNNWLYLTAFVGVMQLVFAISGYCPAAIILDKLGVPRN